MHPQREEARGVRREESGGQGAPGAHGPEREPPDRELRRVGKAGLILEPTATERTGQVEWRQKGTYCLSWDDWEGWYGLKRFEPRIPLPYTAVFYW